MCRITKQICFFKTFSFGFSVSRTNSCVPPFACAICLHCFPKSSLFVKVNKTYSMVMLSWRIAKQLAYVDIQLPTYSLIDTIMNLAQLPLPYIGESKEGGEVQHRHEWTKGNEAKIHLNNICGCGFRSIRDLYYPQPRHTSVCVHVFIRGGGGIDCAGPQTMCGPQGVVGGRLERAQRVLLPCIRVSPPPPPFWD